MIKKSKNHQASTVRPPTTATSGDDEQRMLFIFCDGKTSYAVPSESVIQVVTKTEPTAIPFTPEWIQGVVSVRGEILPVVDLASYFQLPSEPSAQRSRLILLGIDDNAFTVWSSRIVGLESVSESTLEQPMDNLPQALLNTMEAQFRLADSVVYLLNLPKLLRESRERAHQW